MNIPFSGAGSFMEPRLEQSNEWVSTLNRFHMTSVGQDFSDILLILDSTEFPAHRSILAARSSYFEGMFRYLNTTIQQGSEILTAKAR